MPRNLDMEISALRKGWGEWCEEYTEQERRLRAAEQALSRIALSYPTTDEGETLAAIARDALKQLGIAP